MTFDLLKEKLSKHRETRIQAELNSYQKTPPKRGMLFGSTISTGIDAQVEKYNNLMQFEHGLARFIGTIGIIGMVLTPIIKQTNLNLTVYIIVVGMLVISGGFDLIGTNHYLAIISLKRKHNPQKLTKLMYKQVKSLNNDLYVSDKDLDMLYNIKHLHKYFKKSN